MITNEILFWYNCGVLTLVAWVIWSEYHGQ